jgi:hypothetical protein
MSVSNPTDSAAIIDRANVSTAHLGDWIAEPQNSHSVRGGWQKWGSGLKREFHTGRVTKTHQDLAGRLQLRLRVAVLTGHAVEKQEKGQSRLPQKKDPERTCHDSSQAGPF